jgi:hypothetical protein
MRWLRPGYMVVPNNTKGRDGDGEKASHANSCRTAERGFGRSAGCTGLRH